MRTAKKNHSLHTCIRSANTIEAILGTMSKVNLGVKNHNSFQIKKVVTPCFFKKQESAD